MRQHLSMEFKMRELFKCFNCNISRVEFRILSF